MNPKNDRPQPEQPSPAPPAPAPKRRFRIEKLEERIAPTKGHKRTVVDCANTSSAQSASVF